MVKWLIGLFAVLAVAAANADYAQKAPEAPVLPKGLNPAGFSSGYAPQQPQQDVPMQPIYQPQPQQQAPVVPQPQRPVYQPAPQQQPPAPQQSYGPAPSPPQQQPPAPQPQSYGPAPPPPPQQQPPQQPYGQPQQQPPAPVYQPAPQQTYQPPPQQQPPAPQQPYGQPPQQQPPQSYAPQQPYGQQPARQPPVPKETWCQDHNLSEGYHAAGCTSVYYACFPLDTIKVTCPGGTFYEKESQACDYKQNVPACGGRRPTPPPAQAQPNPYGPARQPPAPRETWCQDHNLSEGYHASGCTDVYYACFPLDTIKVKCPAGTFYEKESQACDYKNLVPACGGRRPPPPPPPAQTQPRPYGQAPQPSYGQPQQQPPAPQNPYAPVQQTPPRPSYDCSAKSDGLYPLGRCLPQYVRCLYGNPTLEKCSNNLVFNHDRCDYRDTCMNPPTQPPLQQQPPSGYGRQINPYGQQPAQQPPAPKETWCQTHNLFEGYHADGCTSVYYACFPLDTIKVTCPGGTFYDKESQSCDYKQHVPACGGRRPTPPPAQTQPIPYAPAPQPQQPYGQPQQQPPAPVYQPAPQQTYQPPPQQQPPAPQQPYGQPPQQQPPQSYAPAPQPQPQPQPQQQPPAPQNPYAAPVQQTPPKPVDNFCAQRVDGFHGKRCASYFYVCAMGQTTRLECPTGLWYDRETHECGRKSDIVGCGGTKPTQPPAQQPSQGPYGQQPSIPARQPPRPEFDCSTQQDGIYVRGCNSKYFICVQGTVTPLSCPSGTFYSALTEACDYKANVVECGGIAPTKAPVAQNPVQVPQSPYGRQPQPQQQQPAQGTYGQTSPALQEPAAPESNNPCATRSNGIYGRKCSRFFFVCATKKTYDFICPKDQAFNLQTVKCAPKTAVQACPEFEEVPELPQQTGPIEIPVQNTYGQQPAQQPPAPQPQPSYGQPQAPQQQPPAPQPQSYGQPQQTYQPAPQQQPPAPQPQPQQSYGQPQQPAQQPPAPVPQQSYGQPQAPQQQPPAPQPQPQQSYGQPQQLPQQQQQPAAPRPQQYQTPVQQQQPQPQPYL